MAQQETNAITDDYKAILAEELSNDVQHCPHCGSEDLEHGDMDGGVDLSIEVRCVDCQLEWVEAYRLIEGFDFKFGG